MQESKNSAYSLSETVDSDRGLDFSKFDQFDPHFQKFRLDPISALSEIFLNASRGLELHTQIVVLHIVFSKIHKQI